ncbi:hypothetical protein AgCh_035225 [Apium graveolens]
MSSNVSSNHETNSKKPDDLDSEETLSLCDLVICNKSNSTDDNYQYFSKEEEDFFEFFTSDLQTNTKAITSYSPEKIVFGGKVYSSNKGKQKPEKEQSGRRKLVKYDSLGSTSSKRHTNLILILLGIPPKTQTEKEIMVDIKNRQSHHGPSTFFQSYRDKKVVHHPRVKKGFWRAVNVASCFGGQIMHSPIF